MNANLIAPCGMNCALCSSYLAYKNDLKSKGIRHSYCRGCRPQNKECSVVKKRCDLIFNNEIKYCFKCKEFPCKPIIQLDERYRKFYRMSEIGNLNFIEKNGIRRFLKQQNDEWGCKKCGELICCHNGICYNCESEKLITKKRRYRWED